MAKVDALFQELSAELREGLYGKVGDPFLTVRGLAGRKNVSLKTAFVICGMLKEKGLIVKERKHYLIHRLVPGSPVENGLGLVGCVVTTLNSPYFASLVKHLEEAVHQVGGSLLIASSEYDFQRERERITSFVAREVSGIFVCPWASETEEAFYDTVPVPIVMIGRRLKRPSFKTVMVDNQSAAQKVATHLIEAGCDSFAYVGQNMVRRDERLFGFRAELLEQGRVLPAKNIVSTDYQDRDRSIADIEALLERKTKGRLGIFCYHDLFASRVMMLCHKKGIDIPSKVMLAGFDDLPSAEELSPPLTSVRYPLEAIARVAVESLYASLRLGGKRDDTCFYVNAELVVRASTRA